MVVCTDGAPSIRIMGSPCSKERLQSRSHDEMISGDDGVLREMCRAHEAQKRVDMPPRVSTNENNVNSMRSDNGRTRKNDGLKEHVSLMIARHPLK